MIARAVRVFAPASVANFGVGFDVLGAALDGPGDVVTARPSRRAGVTLGEVTGDGGRLPRDPERNTATVAAAVVLAAAVKGGHATARTGIELSVDKGLPLASGLGSSAASAAAGAKAAALLLGFGGGRTLLKAVLVGENAADGSWHGDNAFASLLGGMLLVPSSNPRRLRPPVPLPVPPELRLVLVHPACELPTARARAVLPKTVSMEAHVANGAALAQLVAALFLGDLAAAGRSMTSDRLVEPARAPLVPGYDEVTAALREAGALGWALAGAGPSLVALSSDGPAPARIARAAERGFRRAGVAAEARVHRIDATGTREA